MRRLRDKQVFLLLDDKRIAETARIEFGGRNFVVPRTETAVTRKVSDHEVVKAMPPRNIHEWAVVRRSEQNNN